MTHPSWFQSLLCIAALCISGVIYRWTSRINQFFFFGRTLPAAFVASPAAQEITKRYNQRMSSGFLLSLAVFLVFRSSVFHLSWIASLFMALLYQYAYFHIWFARSHRAAGEAFRKSGLVETLPMKHVEEEAAASRLVSVSLLDKDAETRVHPGYILLPGIVALCAWIAAATLGHTGFAGFGSALDAMGGTTLASFSLGMLCSATGLMLLLRFSARRRTPLARRTSHVGLLAAWAAAVIFASMALAIPLHLHVAHGLNRVVLVVVIALAVAQIFYMRIRGSHFAPPPAEQSGDSNWRWGMYYYNPADPALFVQSRCGAGYTLNFANVFSWPIALAVYGNLGFLIFLSFRR